MALLNNPQGQVVNVPVTPNMELEFGFDPGSEAQLSRDGDNLTFTFEDGGQLVLTDFYAQEIEQLPTMDIQGAQISAEDFLASLGDDTLLPAAGPTAPQTPTSPDSSGGQYGDDAGNLIGGIDYLGMLGRIFWANPVGRPITEEGYETPGGDFGIDVNTFDGNVFLAAGVFEDARPYQNDGNFNPVYGQISFNFQPSGTTVVDGIHLSGFHEGTKLYIGDPNSGSYIEIEITSINQVVDFSAADFAKGVYIQPPANSDLDMDIHARIDIRAESSGLTDIREGNFTIIVDAVADKPDVDPVADFDLDGGYAGQIGVEETQTQQYKDGWAKDEFSKDQYGSADASGVTLTAHFAAAITFGDFRDPSEKHYALIEIPSGDNIHGLVNGEDPGTWEIKDGSLSGGLTPAGKITLWYDAAGNIIGETAYGEPGPAGAASHKDFFRIEVSNEYLRDNATIVDDPVKGERATLDIELDLEGSFDGTKGLEHDVHFELDAGAQAVETPSDSGELDYNNNTSYTFDSDSGRADPIRLDVDTVDSTLTVNMGWVAEGNNPNKNLLPGGSQTPKWTPESYENEDVANLTPDSAANTIYGAPINLSINGGALPNGDPAGEHITTVSFSYGKDDAILALGGTTIADGDIFTAGGVTYSFEVKTVNGETTVTISISGPNAGSVTDLSALNLNVTPKNYYEDADINIKYTVDVEASSGAQAHYSGSSTVVVDAVADISGKVTSGIHGVGDDTHNAAGSFTETGSGKAKLITNDDTDTRPSYDPAKGDGDGMQDFHYGKGDMVNNQKAAGWEIDNYKLDYKEVSYTFAVHIETNFPDMDGSEKHYVLVEKPFDAKWELGDLSGTGLTAAGTVTSGGVTYWRIEVDYSKHASNGDVKVDVPLKYNGSIAGDSEVKIKTGSYVEEQLKGDTHDPTPGHSGREYDTENNIAIRTDGTQVTYKIDVLNSNLEVKTGWASEGANDAKHLGTALSTYQSGSDYAVSTGANGSIYDSCAPITFNLSGFMGSVENITSITFTFDSARGTLMLGPGASGTLVNNGDGTWTLKGINDIKTTVYFKPATTGDERFNYDDVDMKYDVTVKNTAGAEFTFHGSSQVVIDAVADLPGVSTAYAATDHRNIDYPGYENPANEQKSAMPGDEVTVHGKVTFPDHSGGEDHYILIETGITKTGRANDAYDLDKVVIKGPNGESYTLTAADIQAGLLDGSIKIITHGNIDYYSIATNGHFTNADKIDSFDVDITVTTKGETTHTNSIGFGGQAVVKDVDTNGDGSPDRSGGADGGMNKPSDNYEFDTNNNTATQTGSISIKTDAVETKAIDMTATRAYENGDCNAHLGADQNQSMYDGTVDGGHGAAGEGFVPRSAMTHIAADGTKQFNADYVSKIQHDSSKISFSGLASGESISALTVQFECLKDGNGDYMADTANFMYGNVLIPVDTAAAGFADGMLMANGDRVYCSGPDADGMVTLTVIPAGSYGSSQLYLVPGETFRSDDIDLNFAALVKDNSSGYTKQFGDSDLTQDLCDKMETAGKLDPSHDLQKDSKGDPAFGDANGDTVEVDAVAQQVGLTLNADDVHSEYGAEYNSIVPGGVATLNLTVNLHGDVTDGSESRFLYVKVPDHFAVKGFDLTYTDVEGGVHTIHVDGADMSLQGIDQGGHSGNYFAWEFPSTLTPPPENDTVKIALDVQTPSNPGADKTIEVGVRTQEELDAVTKGGDIELETSNNQSNAWAEVEIPFSACTKASITIGGYFYENSNMDAHRPATEEGTAPWKAMGAKPGHENWAVPLNITLGDINDDAVDVFNLSLAAGSKELGDLYLFIGDAYDEYLTLVNEPGADPYDVLQNLVNAGKAVNLGDEITLDKTFLVNGETKTLRDFIEADSKGNLIGELDGKVAFMPEAESYSGKDPQLEYTFKLHDIDSGHPTTISDTDADGARVITADSVAQIPTSLDITDDGGFNGAVHEGVTNTITVEASFVDMHDTTEHFILIEALGGWTLTVDGKTYGPKDQITLKTGADGKTYYKIPVDPSAIDEHHGTVSLDIKLTSPTGRMFLGEYSMEVLAGSRDKAEGGEITFHNNTAVLKIDGLEGDLTREPGDGTWYFEQTAALYEDNLPNQHLGDYTTKAAGEFEVGQLGGGYVIIETTDLTLSGTGVTPILDGSGNVTGYKIDLPADGSHVKVSVELSDSYLQNGGADCDADVSFDSVKFYDAGGNETRSLEPAQSTLIVDAVADRVEDVTGASDHYTGDPSDKIGGNDSQYIGKDGVAGTSGANSADAVAHFTVTAEFPDTDGSENHYILVEKVPAWEAPAGTAEVYIDGKTYYAFDVTKLVNEDKMDTFELSLTYKGDGGKGGDDIFGGTSNGVTSYDLNIGTMSREMLAGDTDGHASGGEFRIDNNTAIHLDGDQVTLQYSPVDSDGFLTVSPTTVDEWGGDVAMQAVTLTVGGIKTELSDVLAEFKISYDTAKGDLYLIDGAGNHIGGALGSDYNITDPAILAKLSSGEYKFSFEPNKFNHEDVSFNWSGKVKDSVSGAEKPIGDTSKLVIDAVADRSDNTYTDTLYDGTHDAAVAGGLATVTVTADFRDNVNTSEQHFVVLEQKLGYSIDSVKVYDDQGTLVKTLTAADMVTRFDSSGKPYFAVKMDDQADYKVVFTVKTPETTTQDTTDTLNAGTFVADITPNTGGNAEPDYSDNWKEDLAPQTIDIAVVEATTIKVTAEVTSVNEDPTSPVQILFSVTDGHNDTIKDVTIKVPANGKLLVGDPAMEYASGSVTIPAADLDKVYFQPNEHWSGKVTLDITGGTVTDLASGAEKDITGANGTTLTDGSFSVIGVADAPTSATVAQTGTASSGGMVSFNVTASFPDYDNSESHYILVQVPDASWKAVNSTLGIFTKDGVDYFKIPVADNVQNVSTTVSLNVPAGGEAGTETYNLKTGALAQEKAAGSDNTNGDLINTGTITVNIENAAGLSVSPASGGLSAVEGDSFVFNLNLKNANGAALVAGDLITVTFMVAAADIAMFLDTATAASLADGSLSSFTSGDVTWHYDSTHGYTFDAALANGASSAAIHIPTADNHDNIIGPDHSVDLSVVAMDAGTMTDVSFNHNGNPVDFDNPIEFTATVHDADTTAAVAHSDYSDVSGVDVSGMELVDLGALGGAHDFSGEGHSMFVIGGSGNDTIIASDHGDIIFGGAGSDTMIGGLGDDIFGWKAADAGTGASPAIDTIKDFSMNNLAGKGDDHLDLRDLLGSATENTLDNFLDIKQNGTSAELHIHADGNPNGAVTQVIVLENVYQSHSDGGHNDTSAVDELIKQHIILNS